ncbi:hypothetical protein CBM2586_B10651 [Cupriavidus phytorum]|uniref:Uncharacterized protein n=1 Tax=Cupriavidus taiwanensis TaxID=164546 RepID=A0A375CAF2_9BURK|nr:hypothetical protein CBM2586_B10651 [Cupriavidus taiwanensis]
MARCARPARSMRSTCSDIDCLNPQHPNPSAPTIPHTPRETSYTRRQRHETLAPRRGHRRVFAVYRPRLRAEGLSLQADHDGGDLSAGRPHRCHGAHACRRAQD